LSPSSRFRAAGALLVEQPDLGTLVVRGRDRKTWLNGLLTCDVAPLGAARGVWGLLLTKQGKIVSDVTLVEGGGAVYMSTASNRAAELRELLDRHLIMEDAELFDQSSELAWLTLHGADATRIAALGRAASLASGAVDWTGLGGAALVVERARQAELVAELVRGGATPERPAEWLALRIESGLPAYGVDFDERDNPHEASLDRRAVSWTKGCYLGQEVVCMQDMRGRVKRRIVPLVVNGDPPAPGSSVLSLDGQSVGEVTSSAPVDGGALALARVKANFAEPEVKLEVSGQPAEVARPAAPIVPGANPS
jgi:folate-binding protein YgfZ